MAAETTLRCAECGAIWRTERQRDLCCTARPEPVQQTTREGVRPPTPDQSGWHFWLDRDGDEFVAWWEAADDRHIIFEWFNEGNQTFTPVVAQLHGWQHVARAVKEVAA